MPRSSLFAAFASWLLPLSACQLDASQCPAVTIGTEQPVVETIVPWPLPVVREQLLQRRHSSNW